MQIAQWSQDYETGFPIIDQQHQQMFGLVKQLQAARQKQADLDTIKELLQTLLNDTNDPILPRQKPDWHGKDKAITSLKAVGRVLTTAS